MNDVVWEYERLVIIDIFLEIERKNWRSTSLGDFLGENEMKEKSWWTSLRFMASLWEHNP